MDNSDRSRTAESGTECSERKTNHCPRVANARIFQKISQFIAFLPPIIFLWAELRFTVNMPNEDDYDSVLNWLYQFTNSRSTGSRITLLLRQHNEHRILLDRLVEIADVHLFGVVNFLYLNIFGFLGLVGTFALIYMVGRRSNTKVHELIPVSLMLFTFSQSNLVSFAMASVQMYWNLFFSLAAIIIVTKSHDWKYVTFGLSISIIAAFTSAGGLILFPTILLYYVFTKHYRHAIQWLIPSCFVFYVYFILLHYHPTAIGIASHKYAAHHIGLYVKYIVMFLGNITHTQAQAIAIGIAASVAWLYLLMHKKSMDPAVFVVALLVSATAAADGLSRISLGMGAALSSRYTPYSAILLSVVYIGLLASVSTKRFRTFVFTIGLAFSLLLFAVWFRRGVDSMRTMHSLQESDLVYPVQSRALMVIRDAIQSKLFTPIARIYADLPENLPLSHLSLYHPGYFGNIDSLVKNGAEITVTGWAAIKQEKRPAKAVILDVDGHYYPTRYRQPRPDVVKAFNQSGYLYTGYTSTVALFSTTKKTCYVSVIVVSKYDLFYRSHKTRLACQ